MRKRNNKIQAFTLSEMIVVLILTTVVVGLAFSVLNLVQKHMISIKQNYTKTTTLNTLETALWIDFNRYSKISYEAVENELKLSTVLDSITYKFLDKSIIRSNDTFPIELKQKQLYFDGEKIKSGHVDAIKIETSKELLNHKLFIYKSNDANAYIK